ncbi:protein DETOXIFICATION 45, chloroplastic [Prunus persica]|uniref:protein DETOXIFICATION 45, chloroplastic n=1 Tax=Prunus persica TaxID=3760 RepID=UPI0009AB36F1|nr:protein DETOXIFICATION 45, chloroplastic [Prunus persica]
MHFYEDSEVEEVKQKGLQMSRFTPFSVCSIAGLPQQQDGTSCGIITVKFIEHLSARISVDKVDPLKIKYYRLKLAIEGLRGEELLHMNMQKQWLVSLDIMLWMRFSTVDESQSLPSFVLLDLTRASKLIGVTRFDTYLKHCEADMRNIANRFLVLTCLSLSNIPISQTYSPDVKHELFMLSLPAILGQAIDPLAQLMETAYIGRLGSVELASAGISMNIFNYISKLFNIPLLSVATSFVAEDLAKSEKNGWLGDITNGKPERTNGVTERKQLSSVSTALLLSVGIGIFEAVALCLGSGLFLNMMAISMDSPMRIPAERFLSLRPFSYNHTCTHLYVCIGNLLAAFLLPILMYYFGLGVTGAALSTVISQYTVTFLMIWFLNKRAILLPPKVGSLKFGGYIKSAHGFLLGTTLAVLTTLTLGTSMAARQGPVAMAAHQICIQVWLAVSLLTDAMAASGQVIATYLCKGEYKIVKEVADFVL